MASVVPHAPRTCSAGFRATAKAACVVVLKYTLFFHGAGTVPRRAGLSPAFGQGRSRPRISRRSPSPAPRGGEPGVRLWHRRPPPRARVKRARTLALWRANNADFGAFSRNFKEQRAGPHPGAAGAPPAAPPPPAALLVPAIFAFIDALTVLTIHPRSLTNSRMALSCSASSAV